MTALFDIRTILNIVAYPFRVFRRDTDDFEPYRSRRSVIVSRWERGGDGKLAGTGAAQGVVKDGRVIVAGTIILKTPQEWVPLSV